MDGTRTTEERFAAYSANTDKLFVAYLAAKEAGADAESVESHRQTWLSAREQVKKDYPEEDD